MKPGRRTSPRAARTPRPRLVEDTPSTWLTTELVFASEPEASRSRISSSVTTGGILLATDGTEGCTDAVILALAMARENRVPLQILTVVEPLPLGLDEDVAHMPLVNAPLHREDAARHKVREQIHELFGRDDPLGINVEAGESGEVIVRKAKEWSARLIVIGLGRHDIAGRRRGGATARHVALHATVPALVVAPRRWRLPRLIVAGMDFSDESVASARHAAEIAADDAVMHMVHVRPPLDFPRVDPAAWSDVYAQGVATLFDELTHSITELRADLQLRKTVCTGDAAQVLREAAEGIGADVIAVGRRALGPMDRFWLGSTTESLIANTPCSLLVSPLIRVRARKANPPTGPDREIAPAVS